MTRVASLLIGSLLCAYVLSGCMTTVPPTIRVADPDAPTLAQARARGQDAIGAGVRWGGRILGVENRPAETWVEVLALPLGWQGEPDAEKEGEGRFLARMSGFLDPAVYGKERRITVAGTLEAPVTRPVGEYAYVYPVVRATAHHLWEESVPRPPRDPWCDPWAPYFYRYPWGWPGAGPYCW
jgi:outer membrane lipoprotein